MCTRAYYNSWILLCHVSGLIFNDDQKLAVQIKLHKLEILHFSNSKFLDQKGVTRFHDSASDCETMNTVCGFDGVSFVNYYCTSIPNTYVHR